MDVRFIGSGDPAENTVCEVFGLSFARDVWVEVPADADPAVVATLKANPTFEHRGKAEAPASAPVAADGSAPKRGRPPKASA